MNFQRYIIAGCFATLMLQGCKDFLDLQPRDELTETYTFTNYQNFKTYAWNFYEVFPGYAGATVNSEYNTDLFLNANPNGISDWIWQRMTIPAESEDYTNGYARIRNVNIMLANIDNATNLTEADRKHWRAVGLFFRAYNYYQLVNKFGGVPYIEKPLSDTDAELLNAPRAPRSQITDKLLEELQWAEANIKADGDGENTVDVHVVRAFISRFGVMEGAWRKYHQLGDPKPYFTASAAAAQKLMTSFPSLAPGYDDDFNSESLAGVQGILLYRRYEIGQVTHSLASLGRNSSGRWDLTKKAADMYLMRDGQTRWTSPQFQGDKSPFTEFRSRDRRLYFTTPPPYKVNTVHPSYDFTLTADPADREYIDTMQNISNEKRKTLPTLNWQGIVLRQEPHYVDYTLGQPFCVTYTGYRFSKFSNKIARIQNQDINDAPIFRMGEVLLNYAEAKYELGEFNQSIADATINKLRTRGAVAPLQVAAIPNDPQRDAAVEPLLWEIRRERAVELMGEGFRFDDLRRWKKMEYAMAQKLGRWIKKGTDVAADAKIPILNNATEGYIAYEGVPPGTWPEYYYLYPIPSNQRVLNPKLDQNTGWK
ncbi:RagB/SusD family nutrient uptake outer membrane protein [Chitinophaga deserti]|uniref:RagB/SusD family nutrient uptake outer membrane protein n=1 Tax=Chitinophaga deserti TaxID=2164099 RepID=UPI000D6D4476|nr:RagB/SusD family nutrient uptake outer membrane protein [Chitinophaga deserti]